MKVQNRTALGALIWLSVLAGGAAAQTTDAPPIDLVTAIQTGAPILEIRARYEGASQAGVDDAEALTLRTRLGWRTAEWRNLVGLIEFEDVRQLGAGDYNDGLPPPKPFATIADPDVTELNRLQLAWTPNDAITVTLGRQRINLDDQRFIGAVGWRQDEQTFDAVRFDADFGRLDLAYAYLDHINRVFAEELDWESESHLFNASYTIADPLKLTGFAYALDFPDPAAALSASNITYGLRASGRAQVDRVQLAYAATYATQSDYGANPVDYEADYWAAEFSATWAPATARLGYESLEGDGPDRRFQTPLATLHAFQGWADAFLSTPNDGVNDLNATLTIKPSWRLDYMFDLNLTARHHDYEFERTGADLGSEWNASASAQITPRLSWIVKWADYDGPGGIAPADRSKTWVGLEFRL